MKLARISLLSGCLIGLSAVGSAQRGALPVRSVPAAALDAPSGAAGPTAPLPTGFNTTPRGQARSRGARPVVLLTGYWPPTNEAVRRFSQKPSLNPVWEGDDWMGRGYDVVSYFPTFNNPNCSSCGKGMGDLEVDYQDTTDDFARIVAAHKPIAIITFSRGSLGNKWEVEANQFNRRNWINDYLTPRQPTPAPPDASIDRNAIRHSTLPVDDIVAAVGATSLPLMPEVCYSGNGGGFLSEFIAYLGVWYQADHADPAAADWCIAAGHVHVGTQVSWPTASAAVDVTLATVLDYVDGVLACPPIEPYCPGLPNSAFGEAVLTPIGNPSISSGELTFLGQRVVPGEAGLLFYGPGSSAPTPLGGGQLCVAGPLYRLETLPVADANGILRLDVDYSNGPLAAGAGAALPGTTVAFQAWFRDPTGTGGSNTTTAARVTFCP